SSPTPRLAPGKQAQEDRHAHSGADSASVCGHCAHHHQAGHRRGHPASVDTLVRGAGDHLAMSGVGDFSLSTACNSGYEKLIVRMGSIKKRRMIVEAGEEGLTAAAQFSPLAA